MTRKYPAWLLLLASMLLIFGGYHAWLRWTVLGNLPGDLGVRWVREVTVEPGFPSWLITDTAGYVLYDLDDATIARLERDGLAALRDATVPRSADDAQPRRQYLPWTATPLPAQWTAYTPEGRGFWSGLVHADFSPDFERRFLAAAREPGSFYTFNGHGDMLMVMPRLRIAVLTWWH